MTPLDEAPEQHWRRAVDRRNRPAKLKVDRLLRDFGYAELEPEVGDAIEARLAGVALAVAPSLRDAVAGGVVTIYANDTGGPDEGTSAPDAGAAADPVPGEGPAVAADVAQMVSYLKQQVFDARAEAERLRAELEQGIAGRLDFEREKEAIIAEQAAALEEQRRQLADLGAALKSTRQALAETRDEIRRAVGELQALPEPADDFGEPAPAPEPLVADPGFDAPDALDAPEHDGEERSGGRATPVASSSEWLPADLEPQADDRPPAAAEARPAAAESEPAGGDERLTDFDDFLYEADELYEPATGEAEASESEPLESEIEGRWRDEPATALPPPPPAPPSPWADGPQPQSPAPAERPTLGSVLRARGGRGRGRWAGSCSICGRLPLENRRKDLEAAGWDLDDDAAACPQCRGVG